MGKKLYIGNLNYDTTEKTLREAFAAHGEVTSAKVITDRGTGRSRGFAFIEMATDGQAQAAISAMNGVTLDGRALKVEESRSRKRRDPDRGLYVYRT
jgi:RNA recognition motif-containing protein